jgi:hypothetical protein
MISATIRDIAIIIIATQTIVIGVLLGVLIWQIWRLVKLLQTEMKPILRDTQQTVATVRGTTHFVSNQVVDPVISAGRRFVKLRRTLQVLTADLQPRRRTVIPAPSAATSPVQPDQAPQTNAP